jgi:4-hydroxy-2-oxoheptanedioate aldolase
MEHSRFSSETMENCIRAADAAGITTIVRIMENNSALARQAQEAGAQGIVVPHIETPADARKLINAVRYGPEGKCGVCPSIRAANYSGTTFNQYIEYCNRNTMIIPLLEDVAGFENAEEIFSMLKPGLDAIGTGMGDLAYSLAKPGQKADRQHPFVKESAAKVTALSQKTGVPIMDMAFSPEHARETMKNGTRILLYSIDQLLFYSLCQDIIRAVKVE